MKIRHASRQWLAIALLTTMGAAPLAQAQYVEEEEKEDKAREITSRAGAASQRAREKAAAKAATKAKTQTSTTPVVQLYPQATRQIPTGNASPGMTPKLQALANPAPGLSTAQLRAMADAILVLPSASAYERGFAAQAAAMALLGKDDAAALSYARKAVETNALDNNSHYQLMYLIAQMEVQAQRYPDALILIDRFLGETRSQKPEHLVLKGNTLYRLKRYPEAAALLKQAIAATPSAPSDWQQLLMATYHEMGQKDAAANVAQVIAGAGATDKSGQMNLAAVYLQGKQLDRAAEVLERLRAAGQLTQDSEYRQLYGVYANQPGKERQTIAVIDEGIKKAILKPDYQTYLALAQANFFSGHTAPAIAAYQKAAPLAPDGETYLNLAKVLVNEGRMVEAKQAAKQALAKGIKKPAEANTILAQGGK